MKKRIKKIRGTRTCGGGSHKKRRGKGSKGGSGNAGAYGHHFVRSLKMGLRKGGNKAQQISPNPNRRVDRTLNVGELEEMLEAEALAAEGKVEGKAEEKAEGKAEGKAEEKMLDASRLGVEKILGKGRVTKRLSLTVRVKKISSRAKEKIEAAGGVVKIGK